MLNIRAQREIKPQLESEPLASLCPEYLAGFCKEGSSCKASHRIVLVNETLSSKVSVVSSPNILSFEPRLPCGQDQTFDDDGPGSLSILGPRHDNDHVLIQDIKVLPTTDEILCQRRPYMPTHVNDQPHHLPQGSGRLMDICFRHLRYEGTEIIVDSAYHAIQQLVTSNGRDSYSDYQYGLQTPRGYRYSLFRNVKFEEMFFHEAKGALVRLSFDCPRDLQQRRIHFSGLFEEGMLCCLVGFDDATGEASTTFLEVHLRESTDSMESRTGNHTRAAVQLSFADRSDTASVRRCTYYLKGMLKGRFCLIDLPKVLLAGFALCCERLKKLSDDPNLAFSSYIAPFAGQSNNQSMAAPKYATAEGFKYNLRDIQTPKSRRSDQVLRLRPAQPNDHATYSQTALKDLISDTTLDVGQATALYENLSRELAFTQGPPGTGKTFLGAAEVQIILSSQDKNDPRPILVVSQTNHALDDFLADLLARGITKLVRLGAGSKEKWTQPFLLREVGKKVKANPEERDMLQTARIRVDRLSQECFVWSETLCKEIPGWCMLRDHVQLQHPDIFEHFTRIETLDCDVSDLRRAKRTTGFAFNYWISGGDINDIESLLDTVGTLLGSCELPNDRNDEVAKSAFKSKIFASVKRSAQSAIETPKAAEVWSMPLVDRNALAASWVNALSGWKICDAFAELHRRHQAAWLAKKDANQALDIQGLAGKQVIGFTTAACARYWEMLNALKPRTVVMEEASEVMLPHSLCTLFPSLEHYVSIGDHLQLRPQINTMALSMEHPGGERYRLDESLFEKLVFATPPIPTSRLSVQRRMHPDIADLSRAGDYAYLIDQEDTLSNPPVTGMVDRLFWLDHRYLEDTPEYNSPLAKSKCNQYEVDFAAALVRYLIVVNGYKLGDIVVLTPYNGQLALLAKRLAQNCSIILTQNDRETLISEGLITDNFAPNTSKMSVNMSDMLSVASVDNFQGEERKIVIFTAVRSNIERSTGFLKSRNRINVACSRARDGFYILGNSETLSEVPHWAAMISVFKQKGLIGPSMRVCCSRHAKHATNVTDPRAFAQIPKCKELCSELLSCGHICQQKCHPVDMHLDGRMVCNGPCPKVLNCGHACVGKCGQSCPECTQQLDRIVLDCGHEYSPSCPEKMSGRKFECSYPMPKSLLPCGHTKETTCSFQNASQECTSICGASLDCGHFCESPCRDCSKFQKHPACKAICDEDLGCSHSCIKVCHYTESCPPCPKPCLKGCRHAACSKSCGSICEPCIQKCGLLSCEHQAGCSVLCPLPCNQLPCSEPCTRILSCGIHLCDSLCGETCPIACSECESGLFAEHAMIHLACDHSFAVEQLDEFLRLADYFQLGPTGIITGAKVTTIPSFGVPCCPQCLTPIRSVRRYQKVEQLIDLPENIDRFFVKLGRKICSFVFDLTNAEELLMVGFEKFCKSVKPGPLLGNKNAKLVKDRSNAMREVQQRVLAYRNQVVDVFERNLRELALSLDNEDVLTKTAWAYKLHCDFLYFRCRLAIVEDGSKLLQYLKAFEAIDNHMKVMASILKQEVLNNALGELKELDAKIKDCEGSNLKRLEVEMRMVQLKFHIILRSNQKDSGMDVKKSSEKIKKLGRCYPDTAGHLIDTFSRLQASLNVDQVAGRIASIGSAETRKLWVLFGKQNVGSLQLCDKYQHAYSSNIFASCPECGREEVDLVKAPSGEVYRAPVYDNEAFLAHFRDLKPTGP